MTTTPKTKIVVGVDGSDSSKEAIVWAARQAKLSGASLEAIIAFSPPVAAYGGLGGLPDGLDLETHSRSIAEKAISEALSSPSLEGFEVPIVVIEENPAVALLKAAESADLLVVGSSGHGPFAGSLRPPEVGTSYHSDMGVSNGSSLHKERNIC